MAEAKRRGSKPVRTETVTVRLDPRLRYLAEIAARKQHRTLSSFIEWAVEESLGKVCLVRGTAQTGDISVLDAAPQLWSVDDVERILRLGLLYPDLQDHDEQRVMNLLRDGHMLDDVYRIDEKGVYHIDWQWFSGVLFNIRQEWPHLMMAFGDYVDERRWLEGKIEEYFSIMKRSSATQKDTP